MIEDFVSTDNGSYFSWENLLIENTSRFYLVRDLQSAHILGEIILSLLTGLLSFCEQRQENSGWTWGGNSLSSMPASVSNLGDTGWLIHVQSVLAGSAWIAARIAKESASVLVHCRLENLFSYRFAAILFRDAKMKSFVLHFEPVIFYTFIIIHGALFFFFVPVMDGTEQLSWYHLLVCCLIHTIDRLKVSRYSLPPLPPSPQPPTHAHIFSQHVCIP